MDSAFLCFLCFVYDRLNPLGEGCLLGEDVSAGDTGVFALETGVFALETGCVLQKVQEQNAP